MIRDALIQEIEESKYFAVLADEAADIGNVEQMVIFVIVMSTQNWSNANKFLAFSLPAKDFLGKQSLKRY